MENIVLTDWINDRVMFDVSPRTDLELVPNFSVHLEEPNKIFNLGLILQKRLTLCWDLKKVLRNVWHTFTLSV